MENPYSDLVYRDHRKILFETNSRPVEMRIRVARSQEDIEQWIRECRPEVLGLDIEWKPMFQKKIYHKASLLQLSCRDEVLLIQLLVVAPLPPSLHSLLADESVKKVGVGIQADADKMLADHDVRIRGLVDIGGAGRSLARVAREAIGVRLTKDKRICVSNWEKRHLTHAQVLYAALDAWVAGESFQAMASDGQLGAVENAPVKTT